MLVMLVMVAMMVVVDVTVAVCYRIVHQFIHPLSRYNMILYCTRPSSFLLLYFDGDDRLRSSIEIDGVFDLVLRFIIIF